MLSANNSVPHTHITQNNVIPQNNNINVINHSNAYKRLNNFCKAYPEANILTNLNAEYQQEMGYLQDSIIELNFQFRTNHHDPQYQQWRQDNQSMLKWLAELSSLERKIFMNTLSGTLDIYSYSKAIRKSYNAFQKALYYHQDPVTLEYGAKYDNILFPGDAKKSRDNIWETLVVPSTQGLIQNLNNCKLIVSLLSQAPLSSALKENIAKIQYYDKLTITPDYDIKRHFMDPLDPELCIDYITEAIRPNEITENIQDIGNINEHCRNLQTEAEAQNKRYDDVLGEIDELNESFRKVKKSLEDLTRRLEKIHDITDLYLSGESSSLYVSKANEEFVKPSNLATNLQVLRTLQHLNAPYIKYDD